MKIKLNSLEGVVRPNAGRTLGNQSVICTREMGIRAANG